MIFFVYFSPHVDICAEKPWASDIVVREAHSLDRRNAIQMDLFVYIVGFNASVLCACSLVVVMDNINDDDSLLQLENAIDPRPKCQ